MKTINLNPTAKIAIKKNVLKQYEVNNQNTVFMGDDTEFEIELFNPLSETIMCKLYLNGVSQGNGLVLYPGQRVFLERHMDSQNKFVFKTYEIDGNDEDVKKAIAKNGQIKVEYYKEYLYRTTGITWTNISAVSYPTYTTYTSSPTVISRNSNTTYPSSGTFYMSNTGSSNSLGLHYTEDRTEAIMKDMSCKETEETGIITKGDKSNQSFTNVYNNFNIYPFESSIINILPDSKKLKTVEDLKYKKYCSNCGKKVNHKDNFCSYCGNKL